MQRQLDVANTTARSDANKKLLRAIEYLSQFQVRLFHKKGATHVVPDALSRLPGPPERPADADGQLDGLMPDEREEHWSTDAHPLSDI